VFRKDRWTLICFELLLPNYWTTSPEYCARSTGYAKTHALGCRPLIREDSSSMTMQWIFGGRKRHWKMYFSPNTSTFTLSVSFCQCSRQLFPCQYYCARVSVGLSPVSVTVLVFLSVCHLSVWLCQCFCQFVPCQCDCAGVSVSLSPVSVIVPVFLSVCPLSVRLCQCFYQFVSSQYDCTSVFLVCPLSVRLCQCFCQFVLCQYDCASVSVSLSLVSMIEPVFLSVRFLSVWLYQCFY
jgi:hypothetical protein